VGLGVILGLGVCPRQTLVRIAVGFGLVVGGLLPFVALPGLSYRFFYLAQIGLLLVIASTICIYMSSRRLVRRLIGALLLVLSVGIFVHHAQRFASEWAAAGNAARSVARQIHKMYPVQPGTANFYVFGAPVTFFSVPLFISYFDSTVRFMYDHYRGFHGIVLNSWELENRTHLISSLRGQSIHTGAACPTPEAVTSARFNAAPLLEVQELALDCPAKYFEFDKSTFRVREVTRERWLELVKANSGMVFMP